jgi:CyaY protein
MPGGSKIVINTQPPLQEIWLAARSGGYHFKWDGALGRPRGPGVLRAAVAPRERAGRPGAELQRLTTLNA